ncbi:flavodoxin family protein [Sinimarinibacterium thermocellulolyticum]|uniref:NAD(P)H-dependent oxidoreductase n=1 Tax=Sinimarinibacterium thermocellulolyticum TaxID=3170016 RepID=A0ABV2A811_9GAMM
MKHLLLVWHSQSGHTRRLADAAAEGARAFADEVELRMRHAFDATLDDLLWAQGLLLGTPENFGYMSGAMKDFMDRTYYPAQNKTVGLPYAVFISCDNDGSGAVRAIERIATGYGWKAVAEPLISRGGLAPGALDQARELGQTMAAGLALGLF